MSEQTAAKIASKKKAEKPAKKEVETTQASMKGHAKPGAKQSQSAQTAEKQDSAAQSGEKQTVAKGTPKQQITALLNVCAGQASETDNARVSAILGFLQNLWGSIKSIFSKTGDPQTDKTGGTPLVNVSDEEKKAKALAKIVEVLQCTDDLSAIAADPALVRRVMNEIAQPERDAALDCLYEQVTDAQLLMEMIGARFGVTVIDSRPETMASLDEETIKCANNKTHLDWTAAGLVEVYRIYTHLPQSDLDLIKCVMHTSDNSAGGAAYGTATGTKGVYYVDYIKGKERMTENVGKGGLTHCDLKTDRRNGSVMMDMTVAHELGHVVDGNAGWKISGPGSSMRNISKWEEFQNTPQSVLGAMIASIAGSPYDGALSGKEFEIAQKVALDYLAQSQSTFKGKWETAAAYIKASAQKFAEMSGDAEINAEALGRKLTSAECKTNLLYHLWRGQGANSAYYSYSDAMDGMSRPFWQGYDGQPWFTFDKSAWNDKISCYQFRCPKEEFAETYASYHAAPAMGKKKGEMTPSGLLNWFVAQGYGDAVPAGGASGVSEDSAQK